MSPFPTRGAPLTALALFLISLVLAARAGGLFEQPALIVRPQPVARVLPHVPSRVGYRRPAYRRFPDLQSAIREATRLNRPIFLDLFAIWCAPCKKLEQETFSHPMIAPLLDRFLVVKFDIDQPAGRSITQRYRIARFPTTLILDPQGREVERIVGYYAARFFAPPLQATLQNRLRYDDLRKIHPQRLPFPQQLAFANRLLLRREIGPARTIFQRLQKHDPQDQLRLGAAALFGEARALARINAYAQALPLLLRFHTQFPNSPLRVDAYRLQMACYQGLKRDQDAQNLLTLFQKRYPKTTISFE